MNFDEWWSRTGQCLDPEPAVNWHDKRKDLAEMVWRAAKAQSTCYVADTEQAPHKVTFANDRVVEVLPDGTLEVGMGPYPGE